MVIMDPWFSSRKTCAYVNINCANLRQQSPWHEARDDSDIVALQVASIDEPSALFSLAISHCSNLKMPSSVRHLVGLTSFDIYNTTIVEWANSSALDRVAHPNLRTLGLIRVNTSSVFPVGLVHPLDIADLRLIATDLLDLPLELDALWPNLKYISLEHGHMREFPPLLASLPRILRLGVTNNQITSVPDTLPGAYRLLSLGRNPIRSLPTNMRTTETLSAMQFDHTNVSVVPNWLREVLRARPQVRVFGHETPFCEMAGSAETYGVQCTGPGLRDEGIFPLIEFDELMAVK
ncbi:hypothetical protein PINS_up014558 [Pythium insidiosum]|nr:hypothetical protein PINS_up014558 [Pythium insidiosum]